MSEQWIEVRPGLEVRVGRATQPEIRATRMPDGTLRTRRHYPQLVFVRERVR